MGPPTIDELTLPPLVDPAPPRSAPRFEGLRTFGRGSISARTTSRGARTGAASGGRVILPRAPPTAERSLQSLSWGASIANCRGDQLEMTLGSKLDDGESIGSALDQVHNDVGAVTTRGSWDKLISDVEMALSGAMAGNGGAANTLLKPRDVLEETIAARTARHYRVPLPGLPSRVRVKAEVLAGHNVMMWGSTTCPTPDTTKHDFKGKDGELVYEHALAEKDVEREHAANVDRRFSVPQCRELYVTVEATAAGGCTFLISAFASRLNIVLTRRELAGHVERVRKPWASRIQELQRDPVEAEEFQEHLHNLMRQAKSKRHKICREDVVKRHREAVEDARPDRKHQLHVLRALRTIARVEAAKKNLEAAERGRATMRPTAG